MRTGSHNRDVPNPSRWGISWEELHKPKVKEAIAQALGVNPKNLRLPRAIEWSYLINAFDKKLGDDVSGEEWCEDAYRYSGHLSCHFSVGSTTLEVNHVSNYRDGSTLGFRPIVIFSSKKKGK